MASNKIDFWLFLCVLMVTTVTIDLARAEEELVEELTSSDEWDDFEEDFLAKDDVGSLSSAATFDVSLHGFVEALSSSRVVKDRNAENDFLVTEARARLQVVAETLSAKGVFKADILGDAILQETIVDLREAWVDLRWSWMTVRAGRQILTWGTGDFVFVNDLFPKDFQSFFLGRDDEFLKIPSDALKLSTTVSAWWGLDVVWTPVFEPDRFINGERLSFFHFPTSRIQGPNFFEEPLTAKRPQKEVKNGEIAARLHARFSRWELAAYGYLGFHKQPLAFEQTTGEIKHSRLQVYGGSARGQAFGGIANFEGALYLSTDDRSGRNTFVPNSQLRVLIGYELELLPKFNIGLQYYLENTLNHSSLLRNSLNPDVEVDEFRHVNTIRMGYLMLSDNLHWSLFTFVSPSDKDAHLRFSVSYRFDDLVKVVLGSNFMVGEKHHTFFGQLDGNSNAYVRVRMSY